MRVQELWALHRSILGFASRRRCLLLALEAAGLTCLIQAKFNIEVNCLEIDAENGAGLLDIKRYAERAASGDLSDIHVAKLSNQSLELHWLEQILHLLEAFIDICIELIPILIEHVEFQRLSRLDLLLEVGVGVLGLHQVVDEELRALVDLLDDLQLPLVELAQSSMLRLVCHRFIVLEN